MVAYNHLDLKGIVIFYDEYLLHTNWHSSSLILLLNQVNLASDNIEYFIFNAFYRSEQATPVYKVQ